MLCFGVVCWFLVVRSSLFICRVCCCVVLLLCVVCGCLLFVVSGLFDVVDGCFVVVVC